MSKEPDVKTSQAVNGRALPKKLGVDHKKQQEAGVSASKPTGMMAWGGEPHMHKEHHSKYVK